MLQFPNVSAGLNSRKDTVPIHCEAKMMDHNSNVAVVSPLVSHGVDGLLLLLKDSFQSTSVGSVVARTLNMAMRKYVN